MVVTSKLANASDTEPSSERLGLVDPILDNPILADPILECKKATKRFGALVAVDGVNFEVKRGETVGIGGPNGAGKTTFFDLISGLTAASEGEIKFLGRNITGTPPHRLCHLGLARTFQLNSSFDQMTVYENLLAAQVFGRKSAGGWLLTHRKDKETTREFLADFGLEGIAQNKAAGISILARKKLMVATALVNNPDVLLMDEPVGGLTPSEIDEFITLMHKLKSRGTTLIFIEHVMRFLTAVADRAVMMHQGKIIFDDLPSRLATDQKVAEVYLGNSGLGAAK